MKGKRYTTEDKIRILREADRGKNAAEVCRAHNISEVSFHCWKRQFGQMDLDEARKLKELERENPRGCSKNARRVEIARADKGTAHNARTIEASRRPQDDGTAHSSNSAQATLFTKPCGASQKFR